MSDFRRSIRRNIHRHPQKSDVKSSNEQAIILAGLNIMQVLEDNANKYLKSLLHYGPASFVGKDWASVLVWYRRRGYRNYEDLTLFGVWAYKADDTIQLAIASKPLKYSASVYNAESYNSVIKQSFKAYYGDDASLPDASNITFETEFDITRRLALRRELADKIIASLRRTIIQF